MRKIVIAIIVLSFVCPGLIMEGRAEDGSQLEGDAKLETTQDLLDICRLDKEHPQYTKAVSFCLGYLTGAVHYHRAISRGPDIEPIMCPDGPISRFEAVEVFIEWANAHPEFLDEPPVQGVFRAAAEKWPCKE